MGAFLDKPVTEKHTHSEESKTMPGVRYAVSSMQGWRVNMEDSHVHKLGLNLANGSQSSPLSDVGLFAVFDGHGGDYIAKNSVDVLVQHFTSFFKANANNKQDPSEFLRQGLMETFLTMDKEMRELPKIKSGEDSSGCTAVAAALTSDAYVIANAGDSRCVVVGENAQIKFASKDHKPDLPEETDRISKAGGYVSMRRVNGDLAVSRGLGDYLYKRDTSIADEKQQVSPLPDVTIIPRSSSDLFLILACDGIWDVMSNEECGSFLMQRVQEGYSLGDCAELLLDHCLEMNSRDNMSIIIVSLPAVDKLPKKPRQAISKPSTESMDLDNSALADHHDHSHGASSGSTSGNGTGPSVVTANAQVNTSAPAVLSPSNARGNQSDVEAVGSPRNAGNTGKST